MFSSTQFKHSMCRSITLRCKTKLNIHAHDTVMLKSQDLLTTRPTAICKSFIFIIHTTNKNISQSLNDLSIPSESPTNIFNHKHFIHSCDV